MIFPCSEVMILLVPPPLLNDRYLLFYLTTQTNLILFTYTIDYQTLKLLVRNVSNQTFCIFRYHKPGHLIDITYNNCFLTDAYFALDTASSPPLLQ